MQKNWDYAARIVWDILVAQARQRTTITYGEVAPAIKTNPLNVGRALGPIQNFCIASGIPPLTALVVNTEGVPGIGFIAWDIDDLETAHRLVFNYDWDSVKNPYAEFGPKDSVDSFADIITHNPDAAADVYGKVRARGVAQLVFRRALLEAYQYRCAFCELTFEEALEGAHIVAWNECSHEQRIDPRNGLLLCSSHHRLFDAGLMTASRSLKIVYSDTEMNNAPYSNIDKAITVDLHGRQLFLPKNKSVWPSLDLLVSRHRKQEWGELP
jgi:putative restriction endonuclease